MKDQVECQQEQNKAGQHQVEQGFGEHINRYNSTQDWLNDVFCDNHHGIQDH
jgi:hypothetical protein